MRDRLGLLLLGLLLHELHGHHADPGADGDASARKAREAEQREGEVDVGRAHGGGGGGVCVCVCGLWVRQGGDDHPYLLCISLAKLKSLFFAWLAKFFMFSMSIFA